MATLQQLPLHHMDEEQIDLPTPPLPINPPTKLLANGIIYGFRTRHLSCIEENDSDSLAGSSIPHAYDMMQQADETFQKLNATAGQSCEEEDEGEGQSGSEDEEANLDDTIAMIDESRLCDADYLDELVADEQQQQQLEESSDLVDSGNVEEDYWQHSFNRNDIMMTSVYGTLNGSIASEISSTAPPPAYTEMSTPKKEREQPEPVYATPEKRRASNRSFDSTCASLTSSIYGGSMNSSLDLKYSSLVVSASGGGDSGGISATSTLRGTSVPPMDISMMSSDGVSALDWSSVSASCGVLDTDYAAHPEEELDEEASAKCLSAAETDLQSIRRLLEHDASGSVCPSCRISFDKGKRRKLIDTCGHERCYSCMFRNDQCPMCMNSSLKDVDGANAQGYDTGIGGSTSTIVSPLGSPQPQLRSHAQRNAALARYMQHRQESQSPDFHRYASNGKLPRANASAVAVAAASTNGNGFVAGATQTVTVDVHNHNGPAGIGNGTGAGGKQSNIIHSHSHNHSRSNSLSHNIHAAAYSELSAAPPAFATPPTRRRFFNHKNLRSALTGGGGGGVSGGGGGGGGGGGHRRTASNGGCPIDTASILTGDHHQRHHHHHRDEQARGKESNALNTSTCSDSAVTRRRRKSVSSNNLKTSTSANSENRLNRLSLAGTSVYAGHLSSLVFGKIKSLWSVNSSNSSEAGLNQLAGGGDALDHHSSFLNEKLQKDQLHARLGLLLNDNCNGNSSSSDPSPHSTSTTSSSGVGAASSTTTSSSSQNVSPEQTLASGGCAGLLSGSQLSVATSHLAKDDTLSLSSKFKVGCSMLHVYEALPLPGKSRKGATRRSTRTSQQASAAASNRVAGSTLAAVKLALKPLFFEVPLQEPDPPYVGRQWLVQQLSNILLGTETRVVLINGQPGTGKTAFCLQLVEYSCFGRRQMQEDPDGIYSQLQLGSHNERMRGLASHMVGYHFCQADANLTCQVPDFVHSLAAQLCQAPQLTAYRDYLLSEAHLQEILSVRECIADAERVMKLAILEPLAQLHRAGKIPAKVAVILVDALCEAEYHRPDHGHTIASFLAQLTPHFPAWLKLVATVRTQMLELVKAPSYTQLTLDSWASSQSLQQDMLDYIGARLSHSTDIQHNIGGASSGQGQPAQAQTKFVSHLQSLSRGSMLYAKLILDLIARGQLVIKSSSYKVLPVSLAQIFLLHFNLRFPTARSFDQAAPILNVCLAALYPLTLDEIYYSMEALSHGQEPLSWPDFMQRFKLLDGFLIKRLDNTYMFFHSSLREWLMRRDEGESSKFLCDARLGHAAIAFRLSRLQAPLSPQLTLELGHHMLKAHLYGGSSQTILSPRDLQSYWLAGAADNISAALGALRNVYSPNLKVSRLVLLAGASPNHRTDYMGGAPILCIAAHEGILPMVSLLLEFCADVGLTNSQGCTPLILAAMRGHCDVVRPLVAAGSSLGQLDITQRCALVHAARMGHLSVVKYLLACEWTPRPNSQDVSRSVALQQALIGAAAQSHCKILEDLLDLNENEFDLDVNGLEPSSGELALTAAARHGCVDVVCILLSRGAQIDARNRQGYSALWLAVKEGHWSVVEQLLQRGALVDEPLGQTRKTPLMIAAEEGHLELVELLLARGAALEAQDHEGFTALSWACLRGHLAATKCLLEHGCNRHHEDHNGRTSLDLAAYQGAAGLVLYLLDQGGNLEHIDVHGMRPLDRAIACRNIQAVQVFLRKGAKLGPTTWSMAMGKPEILVVLLNKLLEDGNVLYRKNRFQEAAHRYQYALRKISGLEQLLERNAVFAQLRTNLLLNLSRCKRKLNELDDSIDLATQAIAQKPHSYEGYYARAKARMEQGALNEALVDANEAMQQAAQSGVLSEVVEVLKRIQTELLTRISISSEDHFSSGKLPPHVGSVSGVGGACAIYESHHEITDL
ncbi:protein TANC1 isoform X2 [Drosophila guanche]|uniref:Blast:Protein TANC2 n=1 Tax=Drosophila guanche TaxID=7266 RepID=A0A3B0J8K7_DROGU|nr:protein TANC1 isoform X2 [Drosophila guanche]SPP76633.1 blast:Protein TANC2 [Drosophila guanche]